MLSEEGREITIFRLFSRDMCLFSASCMMKNIQFDITVTAEKDTEAWFIPVDIYKSLMENSAVIANYTNDIIGTRFTDVVWLIDQILWKRFDKRLALFLKEESAIEGTERLEITHEKIASHLGTAREVVTRMLKYCLLYTSCIPYFQIFIVFERVPYYETGGICKKYDIVTEHNLNKYLVLSKDNPDEFYHTPDKTLIVLLKLKEKSPGYIFRDSRDYADY